MLWAPCSTVSGDFCSRCSSASQKRSRSVTWILKRTGERTNSLPAVVTGRLQGLAPEFALACNLAAAATAAAYAWSLMQSWSHTRCRSLVAAMDELKTWRTFVPSPWARTARGQLLIQIYTECAGRDMFSIKYRPYGGFYP